jgi:hypothetical protein
MSANSSPVFLIHWLADIIPNDFVSNFLLPLQERGGSQSTGPEVCSAVGLIFLLVLLMMVTLNASPETGV